MKQLIAPPFHTFLRIVTIVLGLMLAACGGGGEGGSVSYTVTATAGVGGSITPASATVRKGDTTSFTVTSDTGYVIDSVTGCGGSLSGNTYITGAITADCSVSAMFALPAISVTDISVSEGNSGTTNLVFTVSLSAQTNGDVTVDYSTSDSSATIASGDYNASSGTLTIVGGTVSNTVGVIINGDTVPEGDETLTLTLTNVSANAMLGTAMATGTIVNDDAWGRLNDTSITLCGDYAFNSFTPIHQNNLDCAAMGATTTVDGVDGNGDPVPAGQDALYGRDANPLTNGNTDGHAGFSFTKLDAAGNPLVDQAALYATTQISGVRC